MFQNKEFRSDKVMIFKGFFLIFILRERESKQMRGRERERENPKQAVSTEHDAIINHTNCEIMTWAKVKGWMLNWLSQPGAPKVIILKIIIPTRIYNLLNIQLRLSNCRDYAYGKNVNAIDLDKLKIILKPIFKNERE